MALVAALAVHAFLILSISFDVSREKPPAPERTLDITLVQPKVEPKLTENPDFLAQQSQEGGGEESGEGPCHASLPVRGSCHTCAATLRRCFAGNLAWSTEALTWTRCRDFAVQVP